ncbi:two-component regulator propeller domain-containing protein [Fluviicola sp.]|uniref:ligand-binding sensor domain-containing protein n=1 Tax=Fluviicola sp. TaxID=1917219 RepID=UPI0031D0245B
MKTILIAAFIGLFIYQAENLPINKQAVPIILANTPDDSVFIGPQLPCYYNRSISEYVRRVFQDSKGNLWFGTNSDGVALYDGKQLSYMGGSNGLRGSQITGIIEDRKGNTWFATNDGITRYTQPGKTDSDEKNYLHFGESEGLSHSSTWSIFEDSKGTIWAGTFSGLCRLNGNRFEHVAIPGAKGSWIRCIAEDRQGNLWFGTADKGAFKFDGTTFRQFSQKDGLCSDDITCILADTKGILWFGSMDGGLSQYNGSVFTNLTAEKEIGNNEVWTIYEDKNGAIWFSSEGFGVYCYHNGKLTNFSKNQGFNMKAVQAIYQDREGRLWFGGGSGLYVSNGGIFTPVTREGPWEAGC